VPEVEGHSGGVETASAPETGEFEVSVDIVGLEEESKPETDDTTETEDPLSGGMMIRSVNGVWIDEFGREFMPEDGHDGMQHDLALKAEILALQAGEHITKEAFGQTLEGDNVIFESTYTMTDEGVQFSWGQHEIPQTDQPDQEPADTPGLTEATPNLSLETLITEPVEPSTPSFESQPSTPSIELSAPPASGGEPTVAGIEPVLITPESQPPQTFETTPSTTPPEANTLPQETKISFNPLDLLQEQATPEQPAPKPVAPLTEEPAAPIEQPVVKAEEAQTQAEAVQPVPEPPTDSPEPTGGQSAEQPYAQPAAEIQPSETPTETAINIQAETPAPEPASSELATPIQIAEAATDHAETSVIEPSDTINIEATRAQETHLVDTLEPTATVKPIISTDTINTEATHNTETHLVDTLEPTVAVEPIISTDTINTEATRAQETHLVDTPESTATVEPITMSLEEPPAQDVAVVPEAIDTIDAVNEPAPIPAETIEPTTEPTLVDAAIELQAPTVLEMPEPPAESLNIPVAKTIEQPIQMSESTVINLRAEVADDTATLPDQVDAVRQPTHASLPTRSMIGADPTLTAEPQPAIAELSAPAAKATEPTPQFELAQPAPVEPLSWTKSFGAPEPIETAALPLLFSNSNAGYTDPVTEDDDSSLVISFDETERRHTARRAHSSRSATA